MARCGSCGGNILTTCTCFATDNCVEADEFFVDLPGTSGNYISTPDSASVSVLGDIDIRIKLSMDDWTPAATTRFVSKFGAVASDAYRFGITTGGLLRLGVSSTGAGVTSEEDSTVAVPFTNGTVHWVRATLDVDNGAGSKVFRFYTSSNGEIWNQLGAVVTNAGTTSIFDGTAPLQIGSDDEGTAALLAGNVYYAEVRNGINGPVVAKFDPDDSIVEPIPATQTPSSFTSSTGEVWTINGGAWAWGVTEGENCVLAEGNGTISHPFQFHSNEIPNPRPFGYVYQTAQQSNFGTGFSMPYSNDDLGIAGGMFSFANPTRLTAPFDGVYMIGAFVAVGSDATDSLRIRLIKNGAASASNPPINLRVEIPSDTTTRLHSVMTLFSLVAGDYFELVLDGSATMDAIVTEAGVGNTRPTMWALWMGGA